MIPLVENPLISIPAGVSDIEQFRRWSRSKEFPEKVRVSYFADCIWVDFSMETFAHNRVKTAISTRLDSLVTNEKSGYFLSDGMRLVHPEAGLSTEPDGMFVSKTSIDRQKVQLEKRNESLEVVGPADMVLEVVSDTSEKKDTKELLKIYARTGIQEYWLVDVREEKCKFEIHRLSARAYTQVRKQHGWLKSGVFSRRFQLTRAENGMGLLSFTLEME